MDMEECGSLVSLCYHFYGIKTILIKIFYFSSKPYVSRCQCCSRLYINKIGNFMDTQKSSTQSD